MMVSYGVCKGVTLYKSRWHREKFKLVLDRNVRDGLFLFHRKCRIPYRAKIPLGEHTERRSNMIRPTLEEAKTLAKEGNYQVLPVSMELYSDFVTPIEVLRKLQNVSSHCYLLESIEDSQKWGRYTFLGYQPKLELTCKDGKTIIRNGTQITLETKHPGEQIRQIIRENRSPHFEYLPTFTGGLVGYFSYDYIKYAEPGLHLDAEDTEGFQDVDLMLFDQVIAFDNFRQKLILIVNAGCKEIETEYHRAELELESMKHLILQGAPKEEEPGSLKTEFSQLFKESE